MKEKIQQFISTYGLDEILFILIGLFMLIWPKASQKVICIIIGIILIILGVAKLIQHFSPKYKDDNKSSLPIGIVELILGILLIFASGFFLNLIPILAGIVLVLISISMFIKVYNLRDTKGSDFYSSLVFGIVLLIVGIILIVSPKGSMALIFRLIGAGLIIIGIYMFVTTRKKSS